MEQKRKFISRNFLNKILFLIKTREIQFHEFFYFLPINSEVCPMIFPEAG